TETPEGREFLARQAAGCFCCYGYPDDPGPAPAYWWLTWQGVWLGLCARCCIRWRHFAATDTSEWSQRGQVAPLRITSLRPALDAA
ncbi:MAG TPA: hypothetical protein VK586_08455, partial [Streptosporangiaceae bacterium]|nr:hypothetical protein [Streptosporangiaceae bacterium]